MEAALIKFAKSNDEAEAGPSSVLGELFAAVAVMDIVPAKDWADANPRRPVAEIVAAYRNEAPSSATELLGFVNTWFDLPGEVTAMCEGATVEAHIEETWAALIRPPLPTRSADSFLPLPYASIAPGGRFRECYYWDTYFTLLGLRDRPEIILAAANNCRWQIERYGFVPNANRTYYLTRSQPPLFFKIVELLASVAGEQVVPNYLPALIQEHGFWMDGAASLAAVGAHRRVVRLPNGALLNRYWDDSDCPREEAYHPDVELASVAPNRVNTDIHREVRAACESGWDFSSRWLARQGELSSAITSSILPADLNSMLYGLEVFIAAGLARQGDTERAADYDAKAAARREAMCTYLWSEALGAFDDFDWTEGQLRGALSAAVTAPLFFGVSTPEQARATATLVESELLAAGGILTTIEQTGMQWDAPNGWAPMQWFAVEGLSRYGFIALADEIRKRWVRVVEQVFRHTGRLVEKYDVLTMCPGGGGEYALQDGFGWTNGVTKAFYEALRAKGAAVGENRDARTVFDVC
ncbi:MAG: alpha,alpha-trehalase TreF [Hyphomonadaceae bacterium]|nr:alpha,alpha-trehalase TreF [Hyphomonadaceae bacterium]